MRRDEDDVVAGGLAEDLLVVGLMRAAVEVARRQTSGLAAQVIGKRPARREAAAIAQRDREDPLVASG